MIGLERAVNLSSVIWATTAVVCWMVAASPASAQGTTTDHSERIKTILEVGWKPGPAALEQVRSHRAAVSAAKDANLQYAYGLVMLRNHQYEEALAQFDAMTQLAPDDHRGWRGAIWTSMLLSQSNESLLRVDRLRKRIPPAELPPDEEDQISQSIRLVAQLLAFLEGPRGGEVPDELLKRIQTQWQPLLVGKRAVTYEDAFDDVLSDYFDTLDKQTAAKEVAQAEGEAARDKMRDDLIKQRRTLAQQMLEADQKIDQQRSAWLEKEQEFERLEAPLREAIGKLEIQQRVILNDIARANDEASRIRYHMHQLDENSSFLGRYLIELNRIERLLTSYRRDLSLIQVDGRRLVQQRDRIRLERLATQRKFEASIQVAIDRKGELNRMERRSAAEQKRTARPVSGNTAEVRALGMQTDSWRRYSDLSLEVEKFDLLSGL